MCSGLSRLNNSFVFIAVHAKVRKCTQLNATQTRILTRFMRPHRRAASWPRPRLSVGGGVQRSRDGRRRTSAAGHATENNTLFSPTRALRVPEPRARRRAITSRPGVLARFSPFARAVDGPFAVPALGSHSRCSHLTPRLESALQQLRSSRFGVVPRPYSSCRE